MRKYQVLPRRAPQGFAVLYASPQARQVPWVGGTSHPATSRARAAARRRLVLSVLAGALALSVLLGAATGAAAAWWAGVFLMPLLCTYLAVLFRTRRMSAEREINVAFFGGPDRGEFGLDGAMSSGYDAEPLRAAAGS